MASLLALWPCPPLLAGEISATSGPLGLGTLVNGQQGGSCGVGLCSVAGGTSAGANLFHRFNSFDTRGAITGVSIDSGAHTSVVMGVLNPLGTFLNRNVSLSGPAQLIFLSPGGVQLGAGAAFSNVPRLSLSTASSLAVGSGRFDVFGSTGSQAALLNGVPQAGRGGFSTDAEALRQNGITANGDLVVRGGLITVDRDLLFDAQAGSVLLQGGTLQVPGGSVELAGKAVTVAAGAVLDVSAALSPPATVLAPAAADGGTIRIAAGLQGANVAGQLSALGRGEAVGGTAGSGTAGKGGRIEITGERLALTGASLDASGLAGGGTVLLGGDLRGANPAVPNAISTTVDGASTVRADALAAGDGGKVVAYASQYTAVDGLLSSRGGPAGGNGGFVETSGATVVITRAPDLVAPLGKGGSWLIDPIDITIKDFTNITLKGVFGLDSAGNSVGANPTSALTQGANGKLYGTTAYGGAHGKGAIFEFDPSRADAVSISIKASFDGSNGANPFAALVQGSYEKYYGTTAYGGAYGKGAIFEFNPSSSVSESIVLKGSFDGANGANSYAALVKGSNNNYYGTTANGGAHEEGAIFEFNPASSASESIVLKGSFGGSNAANHSNGANPYAALTAVQDSNLFYGTTFYGGANGKGAIFEFNPSSSVFESIVLKASFGDLNAANLNNGEHPAAALVKGSDQKYYGTTFRGGEYASGSIFEFDPLTQAGSSPITLKGSFNGSNGAFATVELIAAADNGNSNGANCNSNGVGCKFYGTTSFGGAYKNGVIFEFDSSKPIGTSILGLVSFGSDNSNGVNPEAPLTRLTNGDKTAFYGTTANGGTNGKGTIFEFLPNNFPSVVSSLAIESALNAGGDITIDTTNSAKQPGSITIESPIIKTAQGTTASLTLNAHDNINLRSNIASANGALNLYLNPDLDRNGSGKSFLSSDVSVNLGGGIATFFGDTILSGSLRNSTLYADNLSIVNGGFLAVGSGASIEVNVLNQSGGSIEGEGRLSVNNRFSRTGGVIDVGDLSITQVSGDLTPSKLNVSGPVALKAKAGKLVLTEPITGATILGDGSEGITLSDRATLTASAFSGRSIELIAGSGPFSNNSSAAAAALVVNSGANWAIYADNPSDTPRANLGGLAYNFKQYNKVFQDSNQILGDGNGLLYAYGAGIKVTLAGEVSKVYDGNNVANLLQENYKLMNVAEEDVVTLGNSSAAIYENKNAGVDKVVSASGLFVSSASEVPSGVAVYGYSLASPEASAAIGKITQRDLPVMGLTATSKVYDATTIARLGGTANVAPIGGDLVSLFGEPVGVFADKNSGTNKAVIVTGNTIGGADAGNYRLLQQSGLSANVTPAPLTISATSDSRIYDGTISSSAKPRVTKGILFSGDSLTNLSQSFASMNVLGIDGSTLYVMPSYSLVDDNAGNNYDVTLESARGTISSLPLAIIDPIIGFPSGGIPIPGSTPTLPTNAFGADSGGKVQISLDQSTVDLSISINDPKSFQGSVGSRESGSTAALNSGQSSPSSQGDTTNLSTEKAIESVQEGDDSAAKEFGQSVGISNIESSSGIIQVLQQAMQEAARTIRSMSSRSPSPRR